MRLSRVHPSSRGSARAALAAFLAALIAALAAACGSGEAEPPQSLDFSGRAVGEAFNPDVQPVVLNSALGVGSNRLALGLFRSDTSLLLEASGSVWIYGLDESRQGAFRASYELERAAFSQTTDHTHDDGSTHVHHDAFAAVFHANVDFDRTGHWAAALDIEIEGKRHRGLLVQPFIVLDRTPEPQVGDPLPESPHLTLGDGAEISAVSSMSEPVPEMNELTVPEAVATGKPVLVAIATPAYCQSRFCGPLMDAVVVPLWEEFGGEVQFVHVEPYALDEVRSSGRLVPVPLLEEWQLQTEPWVFIAGRGGTVTAKFEGVASLDEVRAALVAAIGAQ
ncbi:MAG: hypothetical protein F4Z25_09920 [Chloroflexi bacterium]|nr:hypothetical protein [Chloroflexota bacterium]